MLAWPKKYINIHNTLCNIIIYLTNIQWAWLKQTRGCGSLCWCYRSNTMATVCFFIMQINSSNHHQCEEWRGSWRVLLNDMTWPENDTLQCSNEPAGTADRRSSNTSADLPTNASGFTARWRSCAGERWFASQLWYFQQTTLRTSHQYRHWRHRHHATTEWICTFTFKRTKPRETVCPCDLLMCFPQVKTEERRLH